MKKLVSIPFFITLLVGLSNSEAKMKQKFEINGKKIEVVVQKISPSVELNRTSKTINPVVEIYLRYQRLLADGQIKAASELTAKPMEDVKEKQAYESRLGGPKGFKEQMEKTLKMKIQVTHVLKLGTKRLLIANVPEHGISSQFFSCEKEKCKIDSDMETVMNSDLALLFSSIQEGKTKL